jgi:hypothetical protein
VISGVIVSEWKQRSHAAESKKKFRRQMTVNQKVARQSELKTLRT